MADVSYVHVISTVEYNMDQQSWTGRADPLHFAASIRSNILFLCHPSMTSDRLPLHDVSLRRLAKCGAISSRQHASDLHNWRLSCPASCMSNNETTKRCREFSDPSHSQ